MKIKRIRPPIREEVERIAWLKASVDITKIRRSLLNRLINLVRPGYTEKKVTKYVRRTSQSIKKITKYLAHKNRI